MQTQRPTLPGSLPIVLAIGVSADFLTRHATAVVLGGAVLMGASLVEASQATLRWRPAVLVMTEDVYAFDPERFDSLADIASASVAILGSEENSGEVITRIANALAETERSRRRKETRDTLPASAPSTKRRLSGPFLKQAKKRSA